MSLRRLSCALFSMGLLLGATRTVAQEDAVPAQPDVVPCPSAFHGVRLPDNARLCQIFDEALPASMVFYSAQGNDELISFYTSTIAELGVQPPVSGRVLLASADGSVRLVVSPDSNGSQVDILVTSN